MSKKIENEKKELIPLGIYILKKEGVGVSLTLVRKKTYQDEKGDPLPCSSESEYSYCQ